MRIIVVGPGRAGGALAVAAHGAGHRIVGIQARRPDDQLVAHRLSTVAHPIGSALERADLLVVAVRDDAIFEVAEALAPVVDPRSLTGAVHLSGLVSTEALSPIAQAGVAVGAFHPLQTLPSSEVGASALAGAHVAITADGELAVLLDDLATSIGASGFGLDDDSKALYHAAAATSANYVAAVLAVAERLFAAGGVDNRVSRPLVEASVANVFELGALESLTGPIARGDRDTVAAQVEAVESSAPEVAEAFRTLGLLTARLAGADPDIVELLA